jgi:hypothetical protein
MSTDLRSVLAELTERAERRGWAAVSAFVALLPADDDRRLTVLSGERSGADTFLEWLAGLDDVPELVSGPLTQDGDDSGGGMLTPRRVLAVLRCATPIAPPDLAALRTLRQRPHGSYLVVFVGAEQAATADELDLLERGIRRSVPTLPGDAAYGPLAERGIALWASDPAAEVAQRLTADRARLLGWIQGDPAGDTTELARVRAEHAVTLAELALAAAPHPGRDSAHPDDEGTRLRRLRAHLLKIHPAVLQRLDAEIGLLRSDIEASFATVRAEITDSTAQLAQTGAVDHSVAGRQRVDEHVLTLLRHWSGQCENDLRDGAKAVADGVARLLQSDAVDWELANQVVPRPSGSYPHHLVAAADGLARWPDAGTLTRSGPPAPSLAPAPDTRRRATALTAGGMIGGSLLTGVLGIASLSAALLGATTGFLTSKVLDRLEEPDRQREFTDAVVGHARWIANTFWFELGEAQDALHGQVRAELHRRLEHLEIELGRRAERQPAAAERPDATADDIRALVALRQRLAGPDSGRA